MLPFFTRRIRNLFFALSTGALAITGTADFTAAQAVRVHGQIVERDPANFAGPHPSQFQVHGVDVARFQNQINWRQLRKAGVQFAFIKATEGGDLLDPMFADNWRGSRKAGVLRGAYHFYYFCTPPEVQAAWFIRNVPRGRGDLPPVLDMEWNPFSPTCKRRPPAQEVQREMKIFLSILERHYGRRPIIYTTPKFYRENRLAQMSNEQYWLRSTAKSLQEVYPGQRWLFWQHSATGRIPGVNGDVDLNVFVGSAEQWKSWVSKNRLK